MQGGGNGRAKFIDQCLYGEIRFCFHRDLFICGCCPITVSKGIFWKKEAHLVFWLFSFRHKYLNQKKVRVREKLLAVSEMYKTLSKNSSTLYSSRIISLVKRVSNGVCLLLSLIIGWWFGYNWSFHLL